MKKLQQIWFDLPEKSDKGEIHSYLPVYDEILAPYRTTAKNILEIGLFNGASLLMWEQYFEGTVFGIDCSETPHGGMADLRPLIKEGTHNIIIVDATSEVDIEKYFGDMKFQVVIDDGSHDILAQLKTINLFKDRISKGGIMIVEDIQEIDTTRHLFENIGIGERVEIIDLRGIKNRYDDILVIIYF